MLSFINEQVMKDYEVLSDSQQYRKDAEMYADLTGTASQMNNEILVAWTKWLAIESVAITMRRARLVLRNSQGSR